MIAREETYVPAVFAARKLALYAGKSMAEWADFLEKDAGRRSWNRKIPFVFCGGTRYYALSSLFMTISDRDRERYLSELAAESRDAQRARSLPFAKFAFDAFNSQAPACVELAIPGKKLRTQRLTPSEARILADHLISQADLVDCHGSRDHWRGDGAQLVRSEWAIQIVTVALSIGSPSTLFLAMALGILLEQLAESGLSPDCSTYFSGIVPFGHFADDLSGLLTSLLNGHLGIASKRYALHATTLDALQDAKRLDPAWRDSQAKAALLGIAIFSSLARLG